MAKSNKRTDGRYVKTFTYQKKKYYVYAKSKKEAERKAVEKLQSLEQRKIDHDNPLMGDYFESWSNSRFGSVKEATIRGQQKFWNTISTIKINGLKFADYRIGDVNAQDIREIREALKKRGNCERTINDKVAFLSHMFHDAVKERMIDYNPCMTIKPYIITKEPARDNIHRALSPQERDLFFDYVKETNNYYYDVYRFAIKTGMRIGEIGALFWSDTKDAIHVERTVTRTTTGGFIIGNDTKTPRGKRILPLTDEIREVLEHQKAINRMLYEDNVIPIDDTIFKARERGILLATPIDRDIKRVCGKIGIEKFTCHALRSTYATIAIENGVDPRTLQYLLGHANFSTTMNIYAQVQMHTAEDAMQRIQEALAAI